MLEIKSHQLFISWNEFYLETGGRNLNENPYLFTIAVIWFRHHNWLARQLTQTHPDWSDERVFNEARTRNVATYQVRGSCFQSNLM